MDATRLYLADCVGVTVLPTSSIIIASAYKELTLSRACTIIECTRCGQAFFLVEKLFDQQQGCTFHHAPTSLLWWIRSF